MFRVKCFAFIVLLMTLTGPGCYAFKYPPVDESFSIRKITASQLALLKSIILNEGYFFIGRENYLYAGAINTQYKKEITINGVKYNINILLSYKKMNGEFDIYKNMGISVSNFAKYRPSEVDYEVYRIGRIIDNKLIEMLGYSNVESERNYLRVNP